MKKKSPQIKKCVQFEEEHKEKDEWPGILDDSQNSMRAWTHAYIVQNEAKHTQIKVRIKNEAGNKMESSKSLISTVKLQKYNRAR